MDFLNSKHLTSQDGYIHAFRETGTFTYSAELGDFNQTSLYRTDHDRTGFGTIVVAASKTVVGNGSQHDIVFHWDPAVRRYLPRDEDKQKTIQQNDFIVFHFDQAVPGQPPSFIVGRDEYKAVFDSRKLQTHDAFTHFFLSPGTYTYRVGRKNYRLDVADHRQLSADDQARKSTEPPTVIFFAGDDLRQQNVKITAGQTVIWAVEKGADISVEVELNPQPLPPR